MAQRLVLHVGVMKSATSYLQSLLYAQQQPLAAGGVLVPAESFSELSKSVRQGLSARHGDARPLWDALVDDVRRWPGTAVISMEYLAAAGPDTAAHVVERLAAPQVEVVVTARDLNRAVVSMWQETVQNGRSWTFAEYVAEVAAKRPSAGRRRADQASAGGTFWRQQDLGRIVETWAGPVGGDRITVVTVPPPGAASELVARRFAEATGLPVDPHRSVPRANESLGLTSALALRRLNEVLDAQGLEFPAAQMLRKRVLAKQVLASRRPVEPTLGHRAAAWQSEQTARTVADLQAHEGLRLVGAWSDLEPVDVPGVGVETVDEAQIAEAALEGLAGLIAHQMQRRPPTAG